jgi:putative spermidine/putrescine transport system substrate-binding protein
MIIGYAQAYLTETFPDGGPQTWADFWDTKKFPGKRAVPGEYHDFMIEAALMADGVTAENLYPLDLDRAFKKLDELKDDMVFYTEYPQVQQLLTSGAAAVAFAPNGLFAGLQNEGVDTTVSWNQAFLEPNIFVVAAKAPNPDNVFALAEFMADPKRQAAFAKITNYGPGNSAAFDFMDDDLVDALPNSPSHTEVVMADGKARADVYDEAAERYTAFLAGE